MVYSYIFVDCCDDAISSDEKYLRGDVTGYVLFGIAVGMNLFSCFFTGGWNEDRM